MTTPSRSPKKAVNLSIRADLIAQARARGVNLSQFLESRLERDFKAAELRQWAEDNAEAFEAHARDIHSRGGTFGELHGLLNRETA